MKKMMLLMLLVLCTLTGQAVVQPTSALVGSWSGKLNAGLVSLTSRPTAMWL